MVKTFKTIMEETAQAGEITGIMSPVSLRHLKDLSKQMSSAFQSTLPNTLDRINLELNKFGYTLGELDPDVPFDDNGGEDFVIFTYSTLEPVKNAYLSLDWTLLSSGQQFMLRPDGSELRYDVTVKVNLIDPADFATLIDGDEEEIKSEFAKVDSVKLVSEEADESDEGKSESETLEEQITVKTIGKTISLKTSDKDEIAFSVMSSGELQLELRGSGVHGGESSVIIRKQDAAKFMDALTGHYISHTEK